MNAEQVRLQESKTGKKNWKQWGPYLSERQWGTVREDYSADGDAWNFTTHDMARSKAWRWGEEGIGGICDDQQQICFALAFWNTKDPILKERLFGLNSFEGNHGEDVKELYYYLDATPTHSYMKMLYKYPQQEFPYARLLDENKKRSRLQPEFELIDTGIFNENRYFDIFIEYAKAAENDILIRITAVNRGPDPAPLHILPTVWFRNTWSWGYDEMRPEMLQGNESDIFIDHKKMGNYVLHLEEQVATIFCDNETNFQRLYGVQNHSAFCKDGINDYLVNHQNTAINHHAFGTKAAAQFYDVIGPGQSRTIRLRLETQDTEMAFKGFDSIFQQRIQEAEEFYACIQDGMKNNDEKMVQRQAFAGMLWSKQFYYYDVQQWLKGDPAQTPPPMIRKQGRNHEWLHLNNADIISMPDTWEYPWYASWDLAFHCIPYAVIDAEFAKSQLLNLTREWYMHPNGQLPAYEWAFSDVNPPVHAWATWRVYQIDRRYNGGKGDIAFLESVFHKLLLNFTWWVNRKDAEGNNIFQGGFLGLDNIGVFDRSASLPTGGFIEQSDGTSWMAMFCLNMLRISLELATFNPVYQDMATKFFEHFLYIAGAMDNMGDENEGLWDSEDQFFYDTLRLPDNVSIKLKVRSMVGLIPLFAVEVLDHDLLEAVPEFASRLTWFLENRPDLASLVSRWQERSMGQMHLVSLLRGFRMKRILKRMLDETEFLSEYGIRALSKYHEEHPYELIVDGIRFSVEYAPAESETGLFGGNSNWRGPVWMPLNFLIVESLQRFHFYYGDEFRVECPTGSGKYLSLKEISEELSRRLASLFLKDANNRRPIFGDCEKMQTDPNFNDHILFYEYFHGDNGRGAGASHQTGWTGLIAKLLQPKRWRSEGLKTVKESAVEAQ